MKDTIEFIGRAEIRSAVPSSVKEEIVRRLRERQSLEEMPLSSLRNAVDIHMAIYEEIENMKRNA